MIFERRGNVSMGLSSFVRWMLLVFESVDAIVGEVVNVALIWVVNIL